MSLIIRKDDSEIEIESVTQLEGYSAFKKGLRKRASFKEPYPVNFCDEFHVSTFYEYILLTGWLTESLHWAFRGHRKEEYSVSIEHKLRDKYGKQIINYHDGELEKLFRQFKTRCLAFDIPNIEYHDEWRWLFYAQHYGLSTRLLDWTTSPLIALYFAVETVISRRNDGDPDPKEPERFFGGDFGTVWAISVDQHHYQKPEDLGSPEKLTDWVMVDPPHTNPRLIRQAGKFTYHPGDQLTIDSSTVDRKALIVKIILKGGEMEGKYENPGTKIRKILALNNINHAMLFHDVEPIADYLNQEWLPIARPPEINIGYLKDAIRAANDLYALRMHNSEPSEEEILNVIKKIVEFVERRFASKEHQKDISECIRIVKTCYATLFNKKSANDFYSCAESDTRKILSALDMKETLYAFIGETRLKKIYEKRVMKWVDAIEQNVENGLQYLLDCGALYFGNHALLPLYQGNIETAKFYRVVIGIACVFAAVHLDPAVPDPFLQQILLLIGADLLTE